MLRKGKREEAEHIRVGSAGKTAFSNGEKFAVRGRKGSSGGAGVGGCQAGGRLGGQGDRSRCH